MSARVSSHFALMFCRLFVAGGREFSEIQKNCAAGFLCQYGEEAAVCLFENIAQNHLSNFYLHIIFYYVLTSFNPELSFPVIPGKD